MSQTLIRAVERVCLPPNSLRTVETHQSSENGLLNDVDNVPQQAAHVVHEDELFEEALFQHGAVDCSQLTFNRPEDAFESTESLCFEIVCLQSDQFLYAGRNLFEFWTSVSHRVAQVCE